MNDQDIIIREVDEPTLPAKIYKYRKWNEFGKKILTDNQIYLASPRDFEDGLDCNVPERFPSPDELYGIFLDKSKELNPNFSRQQHRAFARDNAKSSPLANAQSRERTVEEWNVIFNDTFGVFSSTENNSDERMWIEYGDSHKGFCVGFDTEKLATVVGGAGKCVYVERSELPEIDFINDNNMLKFHKQVMHKINDYAFEDEYRIFKRWRYKATDEDRSIILPQNCIVEVIIGKNMSPENKKEIREICKCMHPKAIIIEASN